MIIGALRVLNFSRIRSGICTLTYEGGLHSMIMERFFSQEDMKS